MVALREESNSIDLKRYRLRCWKKSLNDIGRGSVFDSTLFQDVFELFSTKLRLKRRTEKERRCNLTLTLKQIERDERFVVLCAEVNAIDKQYPSEEKRINAIWRMLRASVQCPSCGCSKLRRKSGSRTGNCKKCSKKVWFTSGTIFEKMRESRPYLVAIHLAQKGIPFNASELHRLVGNAYSSSLEIFKKIMSIVLGAMEEKSVSVSSFEFSPVICKRSSETEARKHPVTEQENLIEQLVEQVDSNNGDALVENKIKEFKMPENRAETSDLAEGGTMETAQNEGISPQEDLCRDEKLIYGLMSDQPVSVDQLIAKSGLKIQNALAAVSMLGVVDLVRSLPGDRYVLSTATNGVSSSPSDPQISDAVDRAVNFVRRHFHGVSRKYIQIYLAAYWCFIDRARWSNDAWFKQCRLFRQTGRISIDSYVSPLILQFCSD
jgi:transposase-like protein